MGNAASLLWEGAPSTQASSSKPLSDKAMPRDAAWPPAAKHPPLSHSSPEPTQQHSSKASEQYLTRTSGTSFCSLSLLMALSHSYMTSLQSALETILPCKAGQKCHTDAPQWQGGKGRRLWLRTESATETQRWWTPSSDFLSLPAAFLAVKPRGLNKTQTSHQLCQQSKNIVTVVNASKRKRESRFQLAVRHGALSLMRPWTPMQTF